MLLSQVRPILRDCSPKKRPSLEAPNINWWTWFSRGGTDAFHWLLVLPIIVVGLALLHSLSLGSRCLGEWWRRGGALVSGSALRGCSHWPVLKKRLLIGGNLTQLRCRLAERLRGSVAVSPDGDGGGSSYGLGRDYGGCGPESGGGLAGDGGGSSLPGPVGSSMERAGPGNGSHETWGALRVRQLRELCPGVNNQPYVCESGHCCGETGCCTYYYELWWFWLLWTTLILFSCCCAFRHRRAKLRLQQQQRQREINLLAYHGAYHGSGPGSGGSTLDLGLLTSFKLPAYEDVACRPGTPPPPYSVAPGPPSPSSSDCTSCSCASSCPPSPSGPVGASSRTHPHRVEWECGAGVVAQGQPGNLEGESPAHPNRSCRHRRLTGDSGIELCPGTCHGLADQGPAKLGWAGPLPLQDSSVCSLNSAPADPVPCEFPVPSEGPGPRQSCAL